MLAQDYDVVVLGAGAAGMTAAFVAAREGLRVLLLEKAKSVGGSTSRAAGTAWIPGNFSMSAQAAREDIDLARQYLDQLVGYRSDAQLRESFLKNGPAMLDYLHQHSVMRFQPCPKHSDYYPDLPGAKPGGRPVEAVVFDARTLGDHFKTLQSPLLEFMVLGGMMVSKRDIDALLGMRASVANARHAITLVARFARDRLLGYSRGTRLTMGNALCGRLLRSVIDAGVTVQLDCTTTAISKSGDGSHVLSLQVAGAKHTIRSTRAVIFAGGGFSANAHWRARYMPKPTPVHTVASDLNDASTLELAQTLGGVIAPPCEHNAWWFPSSVVPRADGTTGIFPHIVMDRAKPGLIAVDRSGQRFVNEGVNYHEFSRAQFNNDAVPAWLICDSDFIKRYGIGAVRPGARSLDVWVRNGYLKRADSLASLAAEVGIDADGLAHSAQRMTRFARTGVDDDFKKGGDHLSRQNGDPAQSPNPCLGAVRAAPFFAVEVTPADLGTSLGLRTNKYAQLLNADGLPVPGLYACGNDMNSIMGGQYPAPGVSIGPAMTFGYVAALHVAGS